MDSQIFYVDGDGKIRNFYKIGSSWVIGCLNYNAPKVESGTGLAANIDNSTLYYVGEDNRIYKIYWNSSLNYNEVGVCVSDAISNSNLCFNDNTLYFIGTDTRIHYSNWSTQQYKSTGTVNNLKLSEINNEIIDADSCQNKLKNSSKFLVNLKDMMIYPNPIKYSATISYYLNSNSKVKIELFNTNGQLVKTVISDNEKVGDHILRFEKDDLKSGLYYLKFQTNESVQNIKIVIQ